MSKGCPYCGSPHGGRETAALLAALLEAIGRHDIDAAIERGLLDFEPVDRSPTSCARCTTALDRLIAVRDARRDALAARERYRIRNARLARRAEERAARRAPTASTMDGTASPALPAAAAAALARAKARAAGSP